MNQTITIKEMQRQQQEAWKQACEDQHRKFNLLYETSNHTMKPKYGQEFTDRVWRMSIPAIEAEIAAKQKQ